MTDTRSRSGDRVMAGVTLSLGSNMGDKHSNIAAALSALNEGGARIVARSAYYRTEPWDPIAQDWFVNVCAVAETQLAPDDLLALCLRAEQELGRVREVTWGHESLTLTSSPMATSRSTPQG